LLFGRPVVETELTFLEEQEEILTWNSVVLAQHPLGLIPEVLDPVDVVTTTPDKPLAVIDTTMLEAGYIENVVARQAVGIHHRIGLYFGFQSGQQRHGMRIGNRQRIDSTAAFEDTEDADFARSSTSSLAFAHAAEVALVVFEDRQFGFDFGHSSGDALAEFVKVQRGAVAMNLDQTRRGSCGDLSDEQFQQPKLLFLLDTTTTYCREPS
jgi:hypothetical protein